MLSCCAHCSEIFLSVSYEDSWSVSSFSIVEMVSVIPISLRAKYRSLFQCLFPRIHLLKIGKGIYLHTKLISTVYDFHYSLGFLAVSGILASILRVICITSILMTMETLILVLDISNAEKTYFRNVVLKAANIQE